MTPFLTRARMRRDESGAEALEFALVAPVALLVIFGLFYALFAVAAHVSLAHAASAGVRYASIPTDAVAGSYPTIDDIVAKLDGSSPFYSPDRCATTVAGDEIQNAPVALEFSCDFPNPFGSAVNGLRSMFVGDGASPYADTLEMTHEAKARRE